MKPRLFIGSSSEGENIAKKVEAYFKYDFDCVPWYNGVFKLNQDTLGTLLKASSFYDYAIIIWTKDDLSFIRKCFFQVPRDNVIFEHGLFLGGIGADKSFLLCEDKVKIPSDLFGVTLSRFKTKNGDILKIDDFERTMAEIKEVMLNNMSNGYLSTLPSTSLAIGYFDNFVSRVCDWIRTQGTPLNFEHKGSIYNTAKLKILIPCRIEENMNDYVSYYCDNNKLEEIKLTSSDKSRSLNLKFDTIHSTINDTISLIDIPTTLSVIYKSIKLFMPQISVGPNKDREFLETREIENFKKVLEYLVNESTYAKQYVEISLI